MGAAPMPDALDMIVDGAVEVLKAMWEDN